MPIRDSGVTVLIGAIAAVAIVATVARFVYRRSNLRQFIYVGNHGPSAPSGYLTVARFPGSADANASPLSELAVNPPTAIAFDRQGNIYVASDSAHQVRVYAGRTTGFPPPSPPFLRNIMGAVTRLWMPVGLALDRQSNLYVAEYGEDGVAPAVLKFAPGADGNIAPIGIIPSNDILVPGQVPAVNTRMGRPRGVALDGNGSIYVVSGGTITALLIFNPGANSDVAPAVEITMGLSDPRGLALGSDGSIYVTNAGGSGIPASIAVYAPNPVANVLPVREITSTDLVAPAGIAVDGAGRIFVADRNQASILVFAAGASGIVSPLQKIQGPNTGLSEPTGIALRGILQALSSHPQMPTP